MGLNEKADLIKFILDENFSELRMSEPRCDRGQPWILTSFCHVMDSISIDTTAETINVSLIRERILNMLHEIKQKIELDIEKIENENE
jgi:hypothetical protein